MKRLLIVNFLFFISFVTVAQTEMGLSCANRIRMNSRHKTYDRFKGIIKVSGSTIKYDSSVIIINGSSSILVSIFEQGLIYPELILNAGTSFEDKEIKYFPRAYTINITNLEEVNLSQTDSSFKTFRFLIWYKGEANPGLYLFELKSEYLGNKDMKEFLDKAKVTAFGFCSILI